MWNPNQTADPTRHQSISAQKSYLYLWISSGDVNDPFHCVGRSYGKEKKKKHSLTFASEYRLTNSALQKSTRSRVLHVEEMYRNSTRGLFISCSPLGKLSHQNVGSTFSLGYNLTIWSSLQSFIYSNNLGIRSCPAPLSDSAHSILKVKQHLPRCRAEISLRFL